MARNRLTVSFKGFEEMFEKLDKAGANVEKTTEEALKESFDIVTPGIKGAIAPHSTKYSGATEKSLTESPEVEWEGSTAKVPVGFNIREGGLPSVFLMYGTPRHAVGNQYARGRGAHPGMAVDQKVYDSIYGRSVKNKVRKAQKQVFEKEMKNTFG